MVLKELTLTIYTLGVCGGLERRFFTNTLGGCGDLEITPFLSFYCWECVIVLERTDCVTIYTVGRVWWS